MSTSNSGQSIVYEKCKDENDARCVNCIRCVAPALPQHAKSGHPGAPMGCAVIAHLLWGHTMDFSPKNPNWWNRDRFVLSNGHGCALQYLMLHMSGFNLSLSDLKHFRQWNSKTPGHPECFMTDGVEVSSGPLGQGIAQAVGLTIARENMAANFNRPDIKLFDHYTYCIVGDGCLQEGIASEACSLAGHLKLGSLIVFYDDNSITIDGPTSLSFSENVPMRFQAYGWQTIVVDDGNKDVDKLRAAIEEARACTDKPSLIVVKTVIGYGSKIQGTGKVHGSPIGEDDIKNLRSKCDMSDDIWDIPKDVIEHYRKHGVEGDKKCADWEKKLQEYSRKYPNEANELKRRFDGQLPKDWKSKLPRFTPEDKPMATRSLSEQMLNIVYSFLPELIGGSADLKESNKTDIKGMKFFLPESRDGNYIHFGVREHAMVAICNGLFAYGGFKPFSATFLNFYTYAWGAVRLGALSHFQQLMIATHDSIELGEDGPTHQPVEVAALMRATPNLQFIRPCDGNETSGAYAAWLENSDKMTCIALCRGNTPHLPGTSVEKVSMGAYVLKDFENNGKPRVCLAGSGTETRVAHEAEQILKDSYDVRVVSMPCWELFEKQDEKYKRSVIPKKSECVCAYIEAYNPLGLDQYFEREASMSMTTFGQSAPQKVLAENFKFNSKDFAAKVVDTWTKRKSATN